MQSFNDGGSSSSLEMSFDNAGNPIFKQTPKTSAFAKIKGGSEANESISEDEDSMDGKSDEVKRTRSNNASPNRPTGKKKSSFFRLKKLEDPGNE